MQHVQYKKIIAITAITGVIAVILWIVFAALFLVLRDTQQALEAKLFERGDVYTRTLRDSSIHSLARDTRDHRLALDAITSERDVVEIIRLLEDVGSEVGIDVSVDAVSALETSDVYQALTVVMGAEGSFSDVVHTLALLETPHAAATLDQFELDRVDDGLWNLRVRERILVDVDE